jgi:hypothetical protein
LPDNRTAGGDFRRQFHQHATQFREERKEEEEVLQKPSVSAVTSHLYDAMKKLRALVLASEAVTGQNDGAQTKEIALRMALLNAPSPGKTPGMSRFRRFFAGLTHPASIERRVSPIPDEGRGWCRRC